MIRYVTFMSYRTTENHIGRAYLYHPTPKLTEAALAQCIEELEEKSECIIVPILFHELQPELTDAQTVEVNETLKTPKRVQISHTRVRHLWESIHGHRGFLPVQRIAEELAFGRISREIPDNLLSEPEHEYFEGSPRPIILVMDEGTMERTFRIGER